jgi:hypothetical protein
VYGQGESRFIWQARTVEEETVSLGSSPSPGWLVRKKLEVA